MFLMQEKICREGKVLPGNILKVGSFLNQQLDIAFFAVNAYNEPYIFRKKPKG